jgi:hypothetical protein
MDQYIDIVFDGPPSHESGRFVEVENENRQSINVGTWIAPTETNDPQSTGFWRLRIRQEPTITAIAEIIHNISTSKGFAPPSMENLPQKLMLSVSELSEAMEEHRKERGLHYYQCEMCGARQDEPREEPHYIAGSPVLNAIYKFFGLTRKVTCPGIIAKPEGILPELADSVIRNLHMMHSIITQEDHHMTAGEVVREKVAFNDGRPQMHGGNQY